MYSNIFDSHAHYDDEQFDSDRDGLLSSFEQNGVSGVICCGVNAESSAAALALAEKYGYRKLDFQQGDIADFEGTDSVDMVVTLHACDTATDFALYKAVKWNAAVILSVPCCQHEVNRQIRNEVLEPALKYGLIRERLSALVTDSVRAGLLEEQGYETQILEFIDMEHTPKNILIRAVKRKDEERQRSGVREMTEFLHVNTCLQRLLEKREHS